MRIAWFTPWNRRSAIARYSRLIVEALDGVTDVSLLLPAGTAGDELTTTVGIRRYDLASLPRVLDEFDVTIFNMGDSPFHFGVWDALTVAHANLHPAVAILHDRFYLHLFHDHAALAGDAMRFREMLSTHYDSAAAERAIRLLEQGAPLEALEPYALCQPIVESADGFVVHSRFCRDRAGLGASQDTLELFIPAEFADRPAGVAEPAASTLPADRLVVVTIGVGNRNKCLHLVLEALAADPRLAARVTYVAAGAVEPAYLAELQAYARARRLPDVRFPGYVSDDRLHALLARADICVNLRRPCLEGGSASMLEALAAGKPLVVFNDGVYAEVPDDCVFKVPRDAGASQVAGALRVLAEDDARRKAMGNAARRFVSEEWSLERYVVRLLAYLDERKSRWATRPGLRAAAAHAAAELDAIGLPPQGRAAQLISQALGRWPA